MSFRLDVQTTHRQSKSDRVDGLVKRPGELVPPQGLDHHVKHELQLVGPPSWLAGIRHLGRWRINELWRVLVGVCGHDGGTSPAGFLLSTARHVVCPPDSLSHALRITHKAGRGVVKPHDVAC